MVENSIGCSDGSFSILDPGAEERDPETTEAFYRDLNLIRIIDKLAAGWGKDVRRYYRYLPDDPRTVMYRRAVFTDIKKDAVYEALSGYVDDLAAVEELRRENDKTTIPMQKAVWQIREVTEYCSVYEKLKMSLEQAELTSEGMRGLLGILDEIINSDGYRRMREETATLLEEIKELRFVITYDRERISVMIGEVEGAGAYEEMLRKESGRQIKRLKNPFRADPSIGGLEKACLEILEKKKPGLFQKLNDTAKDIAGYEIPVFKRFEKEVLFYLSFASLERDMKKEGFAFAMPETPAGEKMDAKGLYDLALALSNLSSGKKVVSNDLHYDEEDRFFVLTGPNQGGKTTFARSMGQLVFFSRIGLDVPAVSAEVPFYSRIRTHFSVEESIETGRGKLKEELVRLAPMMAEGKKGTFVIINELFTTAASYDAQIMGRKVLKHFTELGCRGIYVTHLKELAHAAEGVVSLRAMLNDQRIQTFKIERGEAEDTPCAENQVNKYRLTYEQLKERL